MRSHIAILKKPYLDLILAGCKKLECRLTRIPCPPFNCIGRGEKVLLKESAGPVRGQALVARVWFFDKLTVAGVERIRQRYNNRIMAESGYWQSRRDCRYCTLIELKDIKSVTPYRIKTKGMRAWITWEEEGTGTDQVPAPPSGEHHPGQ